MGRSCSVSLSPSFHLYLPPYFLRSWALFLIMLPYCYSLLVRPSLPSPLSPFPLTHHTISGFLKKQPSFSRPSLQVGPSRTQSVLTHEISQLQCRRTPSSSSTRVDRPGRASLGRTRRGNKSRSFVTPSEVRVRFAEIDYYSDNQVIDAAMMGGFFCTPLSSHF